MLSSTAFIQDDDQEDTYYHNEIASPLLERNHQFNIEGDGEPRAAAADGTAQTTGAGSSSSMDPRLVLRHPVLRAVALRCATMSCAADALPSIFYSVVTEGKMTAMVTVGVYLLFVSLWMPFWLLSFVVTEWGVYALAVATVFGIGRSVLRMIAFPGASCRVRREIEGEFAKYSVQMLLASVECLNDAATVVWQATGSPEEVGNHRRGRLNDLPGIWRRAELYKNRVVAVYLQVLHALFEQAVPNSGATSSGGTAYLTKYGNNRLVGDIGNVADLTVRIY